MTPTPRDEEEDFDPDEVPEVLDEGVLDDEESLDGLEAEFDAFDVDDDGDDEKDAVDDDVVIELDEHGDARVGATAVSRIAERTDTASNEVASGFVDPDGGGFTDQQPGSALDPDLDDEAPDAVVPDQTPFDDEPELVAVPTTDDEIEGLRDGEFVCRGCYIARRETQLADEERQLCRDCA